MPNCSSMSCGKLSDKHSDVLCASDSSDSAEVKAFGGTLLGCSHVLESLSDIANGGPDVEVMTVKAMARIYLMQRQLKNSRLIDLNKSHGHVGSYVPDLPIVVPRRGSEAPSPWDVGFCSGRDRHKVLEKLGTLEGLGELSKSCLPWFAYYTPKYIEVMLDDVCMQFIGESEMEMDMFDVLVRRFKQVDDVLYASLSDCRWRHFMESDFVTLLIAGFPRCFETSIREQLIGKHIGYSVPLCKLLFFPFIMLHRWVCYAWRMSDNVIVVFDPCGGSVSDALHSHVLNLLKRGMEACCSSLFAGWVHHWQGASVQLYHAHFDRWPSNSSGLLVAHFCWCFNGFEMVPQAEGVTIREISVMMFHEASQLARNCGKIPNALCE